MVTEQEGVPPSLAYLVRDVPAAKNLVMTDLDDQCIQMFSEKIVLMI